MTAPADDVVSLESRRLGRDVTKSRCLVRTADLGVIVTCCELGALDLMDAGNHQPTDAEFGAAAKCWAAIDNTTFDDRDLSIVLRDMGLGNKLRKRAVKYAPDYAPVPNRRIK
jgi:hypothetical protein